MAIGDFLRLLCLSILSLVSTAEIQTLLSIREAFGGSDTRVFDSWVDQNSSVCSFCGVTCGSDGRVTEIELSNQNLTGVVPVRRFCSLPSLEKLSLGFNRLYGALSGELNACVKIKYLDFRKNEFSGSFPDISSLNELVTLYLNSSGFSGGFPWESLRNKSDLRVLSVGDNPFDRTPFPDVILNLTNLKVLYMSNCSVEGKIPEEIGNLGELIQLELSQNYISGEIPAGINKLNKLWMLELWSNELTGELPAGFRNLTNLEFFDASGNNLHGNLSELGFLKKLKSLQLFKNQFTGEVPAEFGSFLNLVNLSLYTNSLTGRLPAKLGSWASFELLDVSNNSLSGPIPPDMCKKGAMIKLLMLKNKFTGEIPATYATCTTLVRFRVRNNSLSGRVPAGIWGLPNAEIIDLAENNFEGPVTSDIAAAKSLAQLFLWSNRLSGELPREISEAGSLVSVNLGYNQFSGKIPATVSELKQLTSLQLQGNNFSGSIPYSLGSCTSINEINFAQNQLSGHIPASLGSLPALNFLNLSRNQLSGQIPASLSSLRLNLLDLSENRLTGLIPEPLLSDANNGSFASNIGLCSSSNNMKGLFRRCSPDSGKSLHFRMFMLLLTAIFVALVLLLAGIICINNKAKRNAERSLTWNFKSFHMLKFTEDDILDSIKPENLIGKGGSGNVYRVVLPGGEHLAVKHIWHSESDQHKKISPSTPIIPKNPVKLRGLEAEVRILSSIRHINVVKLYCSITGEESSLLVYEYMPNGSLWDNLHFSKKGTLGWKTRYEIAVGAARGLEYLHHGCEKPLIHRDVKSSNILLDENLQPRIADFGLAKIAQSDPTLDSISTQIIAGTHGYIAPEYGYTSKVNEKSDIYSFGVVLMELVTGKRPIEAEFGENTDLVEWVFTRLKTKQQSGVDSLLDSGISELYRESAAKVMKVAVMCTSRSPSSRPSMKRIVQMLGEARPPACKQEEGSTQNQQ